MSDISIAKVDKNKQEKNIDTEKEKLIATCELIKDNLRQVQLLFAVGYEARPTKNDKLVVIPFGKSKRNLVAVGGEGQDIPFPPLLNDGERRISSTNSQGNQTVATIYMDNQGRIIISANDDFDVNAQGDIDINSNKNVEIDADNNIVLQSGTDNAVRYSAYDTTITLIETLFNLFTQNQFNLHKHGGVTTGSGTSGVSDIQVGVVSIDPIAAKINDIKVP
jgi:hypothetical protein